MNPASTIRPVVIGCTGGSGSRMLRDILAANTGQNPERIRQDYDRNFYMDAQQAKEYGMIDEILSRQ